VLKPLGALVLLIGIGLSLATARSLATNDYLAAPSYLASPSAEVATSPAGLDGVSALESAEAEGVIAQTANLAMEGESLPLDQPSVAVPSEDLEAAAPAPAETATPAATADEEPAPASEVEAQAALLPDPAVAPPAPESPASDPQPKEESAAVLAADQPTIVQAALPKLLRLPAVGVEAAFEYVGLTPDGAMDTPKQPDNVAWFWEGPVPGQPGNAVVTGHVDWAGRVRALWYLNRLGPGDSVEIVDVDGATHCFVIQSKQMYNAAAAPVEEIFGSSGIPELTLITCTGVFDHQTKQYLSRLVVRAALE